MKLNAWRPQHWLGGRRGGRLGAGGGALPEAVATAVAVAAYEGRDAIAAARSPTDTIRNFAIFIALPPLGRREWLGEYHPNGGAVNPA